jgi:hypothetical protein
MFRGVNENFATVAVEGALVMVGDSVDLDPLQGTVAQSGTNILPAKRDVQRAVRAMSKKWWRSFGYNYVMASIRTKHEKVLVYL